MKLLRSRLLGNTLVGPWSPVDQQMKFFFSSSTHPFRTLEETIEDRLSPESSVLDIGCGRKAPTLQKLVGKARHLHGIDLVPFEVHSASMLLSNQSVCDMKSIGDGTIDLAYSKSVMEHVEDTALAYREIWRVLKPGGEYVFLTPNLFDYASLCALLIPNRYHPALVHLLEGRHADNTFPTYYRSNTKRRVISLASRAGFRVKEFSYLGQYPSYLTFNRSLFWIGSLYETAISRVSRLHFLRGWILCVLEKEGDGDR